MTEAVRRATDETLAAMELSKKLEATFLAVARERMDDISILNPGLTVSVVGMRRHQDGWVCTLITPWSLNLILLPPSGEAAQMWKRLGLGSKVKHGFPAGTFEFIHGVEEGIGPYRMCSLFSPVLHFENQEAALATAEAVMESLFTEDRAAPPSEHARSAPRMSRRNLIFGAKAAQP